MALMPADHVGEVRAALREIVAEHGPDALSDPAAMSNLLKDLMPDAPRVARMIVAAAEDRVADLLTEHILQGMDAATAARLAASAFASATMFTPDACAWVVGEFGIALGLLPEPTGPPTVVPPVTVSDGSTSAPAQQMPGSQVLSRTAAGSQDSEDGAAVVPPRTVSARRVVSSESSVSPAMPPIAPGDATPTANRATLALPRSVVIAVRTMYAGAMFTIVLLAASVFIARADRATSALIGLAMAVVIIPTWLLVARACGNGSRWGRAVGSGLAILASLYVALQVWGVAIGDIRIAGSLDDLFAGSSLLAWLAGLSSVVLLWRREARVFFKARSSS